jgi:hypothetical protein
MSSTVYVSAGLSVAKSSGQSPDAGAESVYVAAGLTPDVETGGGGAVYWIWARQHSPQVIGGGAL